MPAFLRASFSGRTRALPVELALALDDDRLDALGGRRQGIAQGFHRVAQIIGIDGLHPLHADPFEGAAEVHVDGLAAVIDAARRDALLAGGRGETVVDDGEHRVLLVVNGAGDAGVQPAVPQTAVAHHRDGAPPRRRLDGRRAGQAHAVAGGRIGQIEWRVGGERVAADVAGDVGRPELALHDFEGREERTLRAPGAERGGARRQRLGQVAAGHGGFAVKGFRAVRDLGDAPHQDIVAGGNVTGVHPRRAGGLDVTSQAGAHQFRRVLTGLLEHVLAVYLGLHVAPAQGNVDFLFDVVGRAFLDDQHRALGGAELGDLLGHQRKGGVEHEKGNAALAESVGQAKLVEGGDHRVVKAALKDDPDFLGRIVAEDLVDGVLDDEAARRRQPLLHLVLLVLEQRRAVVDAAGREGGGRIERVLAADLGLDVVAADKTAVQVRGADAQHQHHRHVAGLGKPEALLHHVDDVLLFGPGVEERHGAFEGRTRGCAPG